MQWAADRTQFLSIKTAPHQWPRNPNDGCNNSSDTCQGNWPSLVGIPSIIFGNLNFELILGCRRKGRTPHSENKDYLGQFIGNKKNLYKNV